LAQNLFLELPIMASDFGELVLIVGDSHVPSRANDIPAQFRQLFESTSVYYKHILITGNIGSAAMLNYFKSLASPQSSIQIARGDQDLTLEYAREYKEQIQMKLNSNYSLLLLHGHTIVPTNDSRVLLSLARQHNVDVVVSGFTHNSSVFADFNEPTGRLLLNPGSITGAYNSFNSTSIPSFMVLAVKSESITVFLYELVGQQIKVTQSEFDKWSSSSAAANNENNSGESNKS
jgi:vacuolar protein sorting-associated protein 29